MATALKAAAQLYTVRAHMKTERDFEDSMRKVRAIGYRYVQASGIGPVPDETVKRVCDENGLRICITHVNFDSLRADPAGNIARHRLWECPNVAVGSMPKSYRDGGEEGFRRFAADATAVGRELAEAGLTFSYHNHGFEFERFGDTTGLDIIYRESDPRYLLAEIDTYWVRHGGGDPAAWIRRMRGRMPVVHFKDMLIENGEPVMAEVGEGILDWPDIVAACEEAGVVWAAVEQDVCRRDPFESLAISYRYLAGMGIA